MIQLSLSVQTCPHAPQLFLSITEYPFIIALSLPFVLGNLSETRKDLKNKWDELVKKVKELDAEEVKQSLLDKIEEIKKEVSELDREKVAEIAKKKAEKVKAKLDELYEEAKAKANPAIEKTVDELRNKTVNVLKGTVKKLEKKDKEVKKEEK